MYFYPVVKKNVSDEEGRGYDVECYLKHLKNEKRNFFFQYK